jgi:hypothetical protein
VQGVQELTGKKAVTQDGAMPAADVKQRLRASRMLPKTSVREGVARLWDWYRTR